MEKTINVAIADDHGLLRAAMASLLDGEPNIRVIGVAASGEEAVNLANRDSPDVFFLDIIMKGMSGIEASRWIKEQNPSIKILLISGEVNMQFISDGVKVGIDGYLPKDSSKEDLLEAIHTVMGGNKFFCPEVTSLIFTDFYLREIGGKGVPGKKTAILSKREEQVLALIAEGKSMREVGDELFISLKTVATHKMHICDKLGLKNIAQLVRYAYQHNIVHPNTQPERKQRDAGNRVGNQALSPPVRVHP